MENNKFELQPRVLTEEDIGKKLAFDEVEIINGYKIVFQGLIKLLYLIEGEQAGKEPAHNWFTTFMLDLKSTNALCNYKLTKVFIKMHSLYENDAYKTMKHSQIKRQIMESRGIVEYLITELEAKSAPNSDKK